MDNGSGKSTLKFFHTPPSDTRMLTTSTSIQTSVPEHTRNLVEGKINRYGDQVRETVQSYIRLMA